MIAPRRKLVRRPFLTDESKPTPRRTKRREPMTVCVAAVCNIRPGEPPFWMRSLSHDKRSNSDFPAIQWGYFLEICRYTRPFVLQR
jgi:hypothetical protein